MTTTIKNKTGKELGLPTGFTYSEENRSLFKSIAAEMIADAKCKKKRKKFSLQQLVDWEIQLTANILEFVKEECEEYLSHLPESKIISHDLAHQRTMHTVGIDCLPVDKIHRTLKDTYLEIGLSRLYWNDEEIKTCYTGKVLYPQDFGQKPNPTSRYAFKENNPLGKVYHNMTPYHFSFDSFPEAIQEELTAFVKLAKQFRVINVQAYNLLESILKKSKSWVQLCNTHPEFVKYVVEAANRKKKAAAPCSDMDVADDVAALHKLM